MMITGQLLRDEIDRAAAVLADAGVSTPRVDAELLAAHAAGTSRWRLAMREVVDSEFLCHYRDLVSARSRRVPLQHLTGTAAFGPLQLRVGPGVFIPRPETESLLDWVVRHCPPPSLVVDLCTGSGALAIALARQWSTTRVVAIDNSPTALDYAHRNSAGTHVELYCGDVTDPAALPQFDGQVQLLVANPPYLPDGAALEPEVAQYDPPQALYGGADGMTVIAPIVELAARWLCASGVVAIEHDDATSDDTVELLTAAGVFEDITPHRDLAGRPRFVTARRAP